LLIVLCSFAIVSTELTPSVHAQQTFQNIESYRVEGAVNYTNPGSEPFWNGIPWTNVSLAASVSPGGGHTPYVLVKSANNGFNVYMLFRWVDTTGPSYLADNEIYRAANGSLVPLTPQATLNVTQLYYNSSYYYPDRVAVLWFIGASASRQQAPAMMLGSDGAITGGAAEIWHWQSNPTDNLPADAGFPGGYTDPTGKPVYPADNLSFAEDDYTNTTGFYVIGGSFGASSPNLDPYSSPYEVLAGNQFSATNRTWTVEMERSFTTDATQYRVQLAANSVYYVAFAVWKGEIGESDDLKSVSQWYTITIGSAPEAVATTSSSATTLPTPLTISATTTVTQTFSEVTQAIPTDAYAGMAILLIVGLVIGLVVRKKE